MGLILSNQWFNKKKDEIIDLEKFDFDEFDEQFFDAEIR